MKRWSKLIALLAICLLACMSTGLAKGETLEQKRTEIEGKAAAALQQLYAKSPEAKADVEGAKGYAVFVNSSIKLGLLGGGHGRGVAFNNQTGEKTYMRMKEYQAGLGLGAKEYSVIFVFRTEKALDDFIHAGWKFNGEAVAAATDSVKGGEKGGAICVGKEVWLYQVTTKGLAAELGLKGSEYYRDKSFYPELYDKKAKKNAK